VEKSGVLCRVHAANTAQAENATARLKMAFEISASRTAVAKLVHETIL
jgi:thymidine phosphorylase